MCLRPRKSPISLLVLYCSLWICQGSWILNGDLKTSANFTTFLPNTLLALSATVICLIMPMRDPRLPINDIGQTSRPPNASVRSPEDHLTFLQFLTVSWMSPLISIGSKRQLNDEDVWQLGWEFQHRRLHENFRELRGTVVKRLLKANWIDLTLTTVLALVKMVAGKSTPESLWLLCSPPGRLFYSRNTSTASSINARRHYIAPARYSVCHFVPCRPTHCKSVCCARSVV